MRVLSAVIVAGAVSVAFSVRAVGQSQEFRLGQDGTFVEAGPEPARGTDESVIWRARRLLAEDKPDAAKGLLNDWIRENKRGRSPYLAEAYLLRGDAWVADDNEWKALYDYETVIKSFASSESFPVAVQREFEIGLAYLNGLRRKFFGTFRFENAEPIGEELLIRVQERVPGSRLAEKAAIELADYYYRRRDMRLASEMYGIFLVNYPQSDLRRHAAMRQIYANIAAFKGPSYDSSSLIESRALIERFRNRYPAEAHEAGITSGLLNRIDESAAQQMLNTANWYLRTNDEPSARLTLRRLVARHPASVASQEALRYMLERGWVTEAPERADPAEAARGGDVAAEVEGAGGSGGGASGEEGAQR